MTGALSSIKKHVRESADFTLIRIIGAAETTIDITLLAFPKIIENDIIACALAAETVIRYLVKPFTFKTSITITVSTKINQALLAHTRWIEEIIFIFAMALTVKNVSIAIKALRASRRIPSFAAIAACDFAELANYIDVVKMLGGCALARSINKFSLRGTLFTNIWIILWAIIAIVDITLKTVTFMVHLFSFRTDT